MKYLETSFIDYINSVKKHNIHKNMEPFFKSLPSKIGELPHLIFYGPSGVGKYSQMLNFIKQYSPSGLKYERKITHKYNNKYDFTFKISDIHFEIDMELLGCNSKLLFNQLYYHILDVCNTRQRINNIIVCKNFHKIHTELLENFYSYMQSIEHYNSNLIFILLTEQQSFIPNIILNRCKIIPFAKPSITSYKKLSKNKQFSITNESINFKDIISNNIESTPLIQRKIIYKIYDSIINYKKIHFKTFRDDLYDLFIYNIDLEETIFVIISELIKNNYLNKDNIENILYNQYIFLKYYNNNYRPIYHLEKFFFKIILSMKL
tara:strand:+ start:1905 stop:2864 length:960 start_codon:yes stop_codon:yes gene_type:complete